MKRETEKIIDYKGKSIRLRKFTPLDGGFIAQMIITSLLPDVIESKLNINRPFKPSRKMTKDEYNELMTDCLKYVSYLKKEPVVAEIPILNENGTLRADDFGFEDTFLLLIEIIAFNMLGFFSPENMECLLNMIASFTQSLKSLQPQEEQIQQSDIQQKKGLFSLK